MKDFQYKIITPLRTPGGKSKVIKRILNKYIPEEYENYYEPFIGGGSVALWEKQKHPDRKFYINDLNYNLYCFWKSLRDIQISMITAINIIRRTNDPNDIKHGKRLLAQMQQVINEDNEISRAIAFYVLNKISFSGLTEHGSLSKDAYRKTFNLKNIEKLHIVSKLIQDFEITNLDYEEQIKSATKNDFIFLDPPYDIKNTLYGKNGELHKGFNHRRFFEVILRCNAKWMLTYNDNKALRDWYKNFNINIEEYRYCMSFKTDEEGNKHTRLKNELVITNY